MEQFGQNEGLSSKKYSSGNCSGVKNPFAIGILPKDMNGDISVLHIRHLLICAGPFIYKYNFIHKYTTKPAGFQNGRDKDGAGEVYFRFTCGELSCDEFIMEPRRRLLRGLPFRDAREGGLKAKLTAHGHPL